MRLAPKVRRYALRAAGAQLFSFPGPLSDGQPRAGGRGFQWGAGRCGSPGTAGSYWVALVKAASSCVWHSSTALCAASIQSRPKFSSYQVQTGCAASWNAAFSSGVGV